jgi:hypothetical protein
MPDQPSDNRAVSAQAPSLPDPVLVELSRARIDATRFVAVIDAFGPLPSDGQVELVNRLIGARGEYISHRMWKCDTGMRPGVRRKRLNEIGTTAGRLLRLLHRDGADPQPWNLHPAATLALPRLCRIASEHRPNQIWDPPQGLSLLGAMLADLAEVGAQADAVFEAPSPKAHGGERRQGHEPTTGLVHRLIEVYEGMRVRFPDSGPALAFGRPLLQFVRAALTFAVTAPREITDSDGRRYRSFEVNFLETDLPSRITDDAIRGILDRRRPRTKSENHLI